MSHRVHFFLVSSSFTAPNSRLEVRLSKRTQSACSGVDIIFPYRAVGGGFSGITLLYSSAPFSPCPTFAHGMWALLSDSVGRGCSSHTWGTVGCGSALSVAAEDKSLRDKAWPASNQLTTKALPFPKWYSGPELLGPVTVHWSRTSLRDTPEENGTQRGKRCD